MIAPRGPRALALLLAASTAVACGAGAASTSSVASPSGSTSVPPPRASASASSEARSTVPPSITSTREARLIREMLARVSDVRGLAATRAVPGAVLSRAQIIARIREHVAREIPEVAIQNEGLVDKLLGFVPTSFDYAETEFALLRAQIAGYYEPADRTMYLTDDLGAEEASATLAHELVHALQDMRWDLGARSKYVEGRSDRSLVVLSLAEGDATSTTFDVLLADAGSEKSAIDVPDDVYVEKIRDNLDTGPGAEAPAILRDSLVAPYVYGLLFVHALRRRGGWDAVNAAWDKPPESTEQLLHLDKLDAREQPLAVDAPTYAALGAGWTAADTDTLGELAARVDFTQWLGAFDAASAASGWGGDRARLLRAGDRVAFAWHLRYDASGDRAPDEHARAAATLLGNALARGASDSVERGAAFTCVARSELGPLAVGRSGRDVVLVAGPSTTRPAAWSAAGDCALARRWASEILGPTR